MRSSNTTGSASAKVRLSTQQLRRILQSQKRYVEGWWGGRPAALAHHDLSGLDLSNQNLSGADLTGANLQGS